MSNSWCLVRVDVGDYAMGKRGPFYKEILNCAKNNNAPSASVFRSIDGYLLKGKPANNQLFGGMSKSERLIIDIVVNTEHKEDLLSSLRVMIRECGELVMVTVAEAQVDVFGLD